MGSSVIRRFIRYASGRTSQSIALFTGVRGTRGTRKLTELLLRHLVAAPRALRLLPRAIVVVVLPPAPLALALLAQRARELLPIQRNLALP